MPRASQPLPLQGWYVISLRPLNQHGGVRRSAARTGAKTFALSTLRLAALDAGDSLREALRCPRVIVTSPAAVRFAHAQQPLARRRGQCWFALGAGSAAALRRRGVTGVLRPEAGSDSEALLAHPRLQALRGESVGLVTAPGGRGLLAPALRARGAALVTAQVYRRETLAPKPARLRALAALPAQSALLLTSNEAFGTLWSALGERARQALRERPCIVASARLQAQAAALGFSRVVRAADARPSSLLGALAGHVGDGRFR